MYRIDCHVHPDYSLDAEGTIRSYCERAVAIGLDAICFTTHFDLIDDPRVCIAGRYLPSGEPEWLDTYLGELTEARGEFAGRVKVLAGVEVDCFPGCVEPLHRLLDSRPLDYVMGSVHCIDGGVLTQRESAVDLCARVPLATLARHYYDAVAAAAESGLFDAIGHLDIYRRYGREVYGDDVDTVQAEYAPPALAALAKTGVGIEVNTSAFRRGEAEPYPGSDLLRRCHDAGIESVTIGSDCHVVDLLGSDLDPGYAALRVAGYDAVCTFEQRRPVRHAIR